MNHLKICRQTLTIVPAWKSYANIYLIFCGRESTNCHPCPPPQNQIVNWLHALPPSAERNELLAYFERPLTGLALQDLRKLWRERTRMSERQWMKQLKQFAQTHPHPEPVQTTPAEEITETDLECIGWVLVL